MAVSCASSQFASKENSGCTLWLRLCVLTPHDFKCELLMQLPFLQECSAVVIDAHAHPGKQVKNVFFSILEAPRCCVHSLSLRSRFFLMGNVFNRGR